MLDFVVSGQELKRVDSKMIVSDTIDYITARFRFSGDWAGLTKHALFEKGTDTYDITLTDNAITESDSCNLTDGTWLLSVVGVEIVDAVVTQRITTQQIELSVTASGNTSGEPFPPSSGSDVYATLNQETPQTFVGGIPKLAADRVIDHDNEIVDKKHVADAVATVTADDFNHNDLDGLQGGDAGEYYHMTQEQSVILGNTSGENTGDQSASDFDHGGLTGLQGGSESEHYHMTEAEHAALHAHSNKEALDATRGTNTGDQSADEFNHNDLANKQGGTTNEFYHVTAAEKTVIGNTSGTNTGDQVLPTRDSLGLATDDTVTFANLSGTNTGDQDVSGAISTHNESATAHANQIAPLVTNHNWLYDGRDLSSIFTAAQFIAAVRADDWSNIRVGDYWPISLTGTIRDYGYYTCPIGTNYYSDTALSALVGQTAALIAATYMDATYCSITISSTTYYVSTEACTDYYGRTLSGAVVKLEVAAISPYINYGDTALTSPHVMLIGRDCLPFMTRMRLADTVWTDADATNPWIGSALYKTLNEPTYGVLPLVAATDVGAYIYGDAGMRAFLMTMASGASTPTGRSASGRGKLFLPSEREICAASIYQTNANAQGFANGIQIFTQTFRHIVKGLGNGGSRCAWWTETAANATTFVRVAPEGMLTNWFASTTNGIPLCFVIA